MLQYKIIISPMEIWQGILLICGGIITIGGAITVVKSWLIKIKKPQTEVKEKINGIEETLEEHQQFFKNDKKEIAEIKKGQQILYKSHLALISHALDGNDVKQLREVKDELHDFLIARK